MQIYLTQLKNALYLTGNQLFILSENPGKTPEITFFDMILKQKRRKQKCSLYTDIQCFMGATGFQKLIH